MWNIDREPLFCTQFTKQKVCPILYFRDVKPFLKQALVYMCLQYKSFENTKGKKEIACNEIFLLFPVFSNYLENFLSFLSNLILSLRRV